MGIEDCVVGTNEGLLVGVCEGFNVGEMVGFIVGCIVEGDALGVDVGSGSSIRRTR